MSTVVLGQYDAIIVGGGIVGTAIARALASEGHRTGLFESTVLGDGASSRNIGFVWTHGRKGLPLEIARMNRVLLDSFYEEAHGDFDYRRNGGLVLCETEAQIPLMHEFVAARKKDGLSVEFIDRDAVLELAPDVSPSVVGGSYCTEDAQIRTGTLVRALAAAARRAGAEIHEGVQVLEITTQHGRSTGVETHEGRYEAPIIVWAGGPWHRIATSDGTLELPIKSMRNQLIATTPQPPRLRTVLYGAVCLSNYLDLVADLPSYTPELFDFAFTEPGETIMDAISQRSDGAYIFGGPIDSAGFSWSADVNGIGRVLRRLVRLFPGLAGAGLESAWGGRIPYTADHLPIVDWHQQVQGLIVAGGFSFGNSSALVAADLVADLVTERPTQKWADAVRITRPALLEEITWSLG